MLYGGMLVLPRGKQRDFSREVRWSLESLMKSRKFLEVSWSPLKSHEVSWSLLKSWSLEINWFSLVYEVSWSLVKSLEVRWSLMKSLKVAWSPLKSCEVCCSPLKSFEVLWSPLKSFEVFEVFEVFRSLLKSWSPLFPPWVLRCIIRGVFSLLGYLLKDIFLYFMINMFQIEINNRYFIIFQLYFSLSIQWFFIY